MAVEDTVKEILLEILEVDEKDIVPKAHLIKDLSASSVDLVVIMAAVENEFDMDIPDEDAPEIRTVQALMDYIKKKTS